MTFSEISKNINKELQPLKEVLKKLRNEGKVLLAILFGSYANGKTHKRSDIDIAIYVNAKNDEEEIEIINKILLSSERDINILRLNDDEESPFIIQEALKGIHLIEPDKDCLYNVASRVLHETEEIRYRRLSSER